MHLQKVDKKIRQGPPPPSFGQNPKDQQLFFVRTSQSAKTFARHCFCHLFLEVQFELGAPPPPECNALCPPPSLWEPLAIVAELPQCTRQSIGKAWPVRIVQIKEDAGSFLTLLLLQKEIIIKWTQ